MSKPAVCRRWSSRHELALAELRRRLDAVRRTLIAARGRGDLDISLTVDILSPLVFYRLLFGPTPPSEVDVEHAVMTLLRGIASDFEELTAEYRDPPDEHTGAGTAH